MTEYHHLINHQGLWFILLNTAVYGGKMTECGKSGHLSYFHFFEAQNYAFELQFFQGFIFTPYQRH